MKELLYEKKVDCPSCKNSFITQKVRSLRLRVIERESDLNVLYRDINPNYYQVWICPNCGFSATESEFRDLTREQRDLIHQKISRRWNQRDFGGVRDFKDAEESYKLALLVAQLLDKPKGYIGSICLRLAWIYRGQDMEEEEKEYLKYALNNFERAYQQEPLPIAGLDEVSLSYLVGELHRKLDKPKEAIVWYAKALDNPGIKRKRQLQLMAREQWARAREQYKEK